LRRLAASDHIAPRSGPNPSTGCYTGTEQQEVCMPIKAINDRKKLSSDFNEANDAFIDEVLNALQGGRIPLDLARAYLAHPVAMMHTDGAQAVANYFERMLAQRPNIDWTPGS
jgi:hypothetical protein